MRSSSPSVGLIAAALSLWALLPSPLAGQATEPPTLRPERTGWVETSSYAEVMDHLRWAAAAHPRMHLTTFGYTNQGRALPLLVVGPEVPEAATAEAVRQSGALRIYLQGNIHGGEVAGKEALLRLVRQWVESDPERWTEGWILLVAPIYNADGNEAVDLGNRPRQHGPLGGMGTRANATGLDLNRDQMKLDSPEARSLAALLTDWDPHVVVDLHVTNGTRHAYHLTYAPGLHPATPEPLDRFLRDALLPEVTRAMEAADGTLAWHYGNVGVQGGVRGWWTFDHRPRFVTNYAGVRGRLGILSEAYAYLTFEDRVLATERFVEEILRFLHPRQEAVRRLVEEGAATDARTLPGSRIPLRASLPANPAEVVILMGEVQEELHPWTGAPILRRLDRVIPESMPAGVAFEATEWTQVPDGYVLPAETRSVVDRLRAHGVRVETLPPGWSERGEHFVVAEARAEERPFQGRTEREVTGAWAPTSLTLPEGGFYIPTGQPLGRLAVLLLEPRSDDGFLNWGILDPWIEAGRPLPVGRRPHAP
jgi:hypothetical protein